MKLQYSGHLMRRVDSLEKSLMLGGTGGRRRRGQQRMRWLHGITELNGHESEWTPGVGDGQGGLACCDSCGVNSQTWLSDCTELNWTECDLTSLLPGFHLKNRLATWCYVDLPIKVLKFEQQFRPSSPAPMMPALERTQWYSSTKDACLLCLWCKM